MASCCGALPPRAVSTCRSASSARGAKHGLQLGWSSEGKLH